MGEIINFDSYFSNGWLNHQLELHVPFMKAIACHSSRTVKKEVMIAHKCLQRLKVDFEAVFPNPFPMSQCSFTEHGHVRTITSQQKAPENPSKTSKKPQNRKLKEVELILQSDVQEAKRLDFRRWARVIASDIGFRQWLKCHDSVKVVFMSDGS